MRVAPADEVEVAGLEVGPLVVQFGEHDAGGVGPPVDLGGEPAGVDVGRRA